MPPRCSGWLGVVHPVYPWSYLLFDKWSVGSDTALAFDTIFSGFAQRYIDESVMTPRLR